MQHNPRRETFESPTISNTSNLVVNLDHWCSAANDDSIQCFLKTTLQSMISGQSRELHIEQETEFCRVRIRINGRLTEQKFYNPDFATELLTAINQESNGKNPHARRPGDTGNNGADSDNAGAVNAANDEFGSLTIPVQIDGEKCDLNICRYDTISGKCLTLSVSAASTIPEVLEQTRLDTATKQDIRHHYSSMPVKGITMICSHSDDLLRSVYYALLGEVNNVERKIVSLQNNIDKQVPRVSQILANGNANQSGNKRSLLTAVSTVTRLSDHVFVDWETACDEGIINALQSNAQSTLFWRGNVSSGLLQLFSAENLRLNLHTIIELEDTALICPHCAETYKPGKLDFKRLPETMSDQNSGSFFFANGCDRCDDTGVSSLATVTSMCKGTDAIREALANRSLQATERALASAQGRTSIRLQLEALAKTGKISFEDWIGQQ